MITAHTWPFDKVDKPRTSTLEEAYEDIKPLKEDGRLCGPASTPCDSNVESVISRYRDRAQVGLTKYGVTTERTDVSFFGWINHLQEELMDAVIYIERLKKELK